MQAAGRGRTVLLDRTGSGLDADRARRCAEEVRRQGRRVGTLDLDLDGNFELDLDDGELRFKALLEGRREGLDAELLDRHLAAVNATVDTYLPGLQAVLAGADPAASARAVDNAAASDG